MKSINLSATSSLTTIIYTGLAEPGIYRAAGSPTQVQKLKAMFDVDAKQVNLHDPEWRADVCSVAALLKTYLRELPMPLFPEHMYQAFIEAARMVDV